MDIVWSDYVSPAPVVGQEQVAAFADATGLSLPADYAAIVTTHAGQVTDRETIAIGGGRTVVGPLFFIDSDRAHEKKVYNAFHAWDAINDWIGRDFPDYGRFVPFTSNTSTGYFCFDKSTDGPAVVFVDLGFDPDEDEAILPVASSFSEFLDRLE